MTVLSVEYDPLSSRVLADPYPTYAELRQRAPILWHEQMNSWVLSRYSDCVRVLQSHESFARDRRRAGIEVPGFLESLQTLDPPAQKEVRKLFVGTFRSLGVPHLRDIAREIVGEVLNPFLEGGECEWMADVAQPAALRLTARLMGVATPDAVEYEALSSAIARRMDSGLTPSSATPGDDARQRLNDIVARWLSDPRNGGFIGEVAERSRNWQIDRHLVVNTTGVMFNASYSTLHAAIGNVVWTLVSHADSYEELRSRFSEVRETAADEFLRFDGPAQGTTRVALADCEFYGQQVRSGDLIVTLMASANHDEAQFERPESLILDRSPNKHLAFGSGTHACLGATFGRVVVKELLSALARAPRRIGAIGEAQRRPTATVRCLASMRAQFA